MKRISTYSFLASLVMAIHAAGAAIAPAALSQPSVVASSIAPAAITVERCTNGVLLNFRGAPLSQVLEYLSEAAGFIINKEIEVHGTVEMWSKGPVTREEAVELLNTVLRARGATAIRTGRVLTIASLDRTKTADLDIITGSDPDAVEKSDAVVTQIIPIRNADASQLVNNLQPLLPPSASLSVNASANALILVDNKTAVRRMLRIVAAIDIASARFSSIKVFPLRYADAKELATTVQQMFTTPGASQNSSGGDFSAQSFGPPGGGGFGPPGLDGPPGSQVSSGSTGGTVTAPKVVAAADERANALIVAASANLIPAVAKLVQQLDQQVNDLTQMRVFRLQNADPTELVDQLAQLFPDQSGNGPSEGQLTLNMGGPPGPPGSGGFGADTSSAQSDSGERKKRQGRVLAVADLRSSSILVSAGSARMPQIAALIKQLDADAGRKEVVSTWNLRNADPMDVQQVLQDLFNRNTTAQNNNSSNPLLGQINPLIARQTQQATSTTTTRNSGLGSAGAGGGSSSPSGN